MKIKLLIMVLLVLATALAPYPRAKADGLCHAETIATTSTSPVRTVEARPTCRSAGGDLPHPPSHDSYTIAIAYCYYPATGQEGGGECCW